MYLSRQNTCTSRQHFCCDKRTFVATKDLFCCDKHVFVATKISLLRQKVLLCLSPQSTLLSRQRTCFVVKKHTRVCREIDNMKNDTCGSSHPRDVVLRCLHVAAGTSKSLAPEGRRLTEGSVSQLLLQANVQPVCRNGY